MVTLAILRFFFSLKTTRIFGPFTKMIKLIARSLLLWVLFTSLLIVLASNYLTILLQENNGCSGIYSCAKTLIEGGVGRIVYDKMDSNWMAQISLSYISIILAAVLVNIVVA